ncbi:hypothetical protein PQQ99_36435 [Paraburkholderia sediminicola]
MDLDERFGSGGEKVVHGKVDPRLWDVDVKRDRIIVISFVSL